MHTFVAPHAPKTVTLRSVEDRSSATEIEIKLRIPKSAIAQLLRHPALAQHKSGRARRHKLVSTYFDTPNLALARAGVGVRMRRDGRRWIQTVKGPADDESAAGTVQRALGASVGRGRREAGPKCENERDERAEDDIPSDQSSSLKVVH